MTVRVGVVGVGMIGQDHIRRLTRVLSGVDVVAVSDVDIGRAEAVAGGLRDVRVHATGEQLVADDRVDAVLVCSWGETHEQYVLAAIAAGKPVFCEKPLATSQEACRRILAAETAAGRRLVQVGYMRRYDPAYRALREVVQDGSLGLPLLMHCTHRNPSVPAHCSPRRSPRCRRCGRGAPGTPATCPTRWSCCWRPGRGSSSTSRCR